MTSANRTLLVTILMALTSLIVSGFVAYSSETSGIKERVRAIEVHQGHDQDRLERMESKIDTIYEYMTGVKP